MRHFLSTEDWSGVEIAQMLEIATQLKRQPLQATMHGKSIALVFFNNSLRTRTSFEIGAWQLGGKAIVLSPGKDAWPLAFDFGAVMDGTAEEHVAEAAQVLSRYCDLIAVRCFPVFQNWELDREDQVINAFAEHASVPVINMETIVHPCQELALAMTMQEQFGNLENRKFVLTWTYHPRPLNTAVANSALMIATKMGMDVTLLCPTEDYLLDARFMEAAQDYSAAAGHQLTVSHDIESAYFGAEMVYAKSWGALPYFGRWEEEQPIRDAYQHFIVDEKKMSLTNDARFSHCLPLRRNVKATDVVMDADYCIAIDEAENRLHVQKALMATLLNQ